MRGFSGRRRAPNKVYIIQNVAKDFSFSHSKSKQQTAEPREIYDDALVLFYFICSQILALVPTCTTHTKALLSLHHIKQNANNKNFPPSHSQFLGFLERKLFEGFIASIAYIYIYVLNCCLHFV
jgi:hypothetical protein